VLPVGYTIMMVLVSGRFPKYFPDTMVLFGKPAPSLIFAPTMFPVYFDMWLASHNYFGIGSILDTFVFRLSLVLILNLVLYSIIVWMVLRFFNLPKEKQTGETPPPPPDEMQV